ncbi:MAG: hypothetical protein ACI3W5_00480 [Faecousia sp.]
MNWKSLGKKLLVPPAWITVLLVIFTAAAVPMVFICGLEESPIAYGVYAVAFYTVCVVTAWCVYRLPDAYKRLRRRVEANPLGNRCLTDPLYKTWVSLWCSFLISLLFAASHVVSWYVSENPWYGILAAYYGILALLRFLLTEPIRADSYERQQRRARICGGILLLVNFTLSGAVLMILHRNQGFEYQGFLIYVMAMYTFYAVIHAIVDMVRYRGMGNPALNAAKIISLCAALVSMLNLETAMFAQFGAEMEENNQRLMVALTGAGVSAAIITLSVWMLIPRGKNKENSE